MDPTHEVEKKTTAQLVMEYIDRSICVNGTPVPVSMEEIDMEKYASIRDVSEVGVKELE